MSAVNSKVPAKPEKVTIETRTGAAVVKDKDGRIISIDGKPVDPAVKTGGGNDGHHKA